MHLTRRNFIKSSGLVLGSLPFISLANTFSSNSIIKVGLVGCGGRGTGAAVQALTADPHVHITALADIFSDQVEQAVNLLSRKDATRVNVPKEKQFVGFDSYKKLIDSDVDVVLLCSPPNFRPDHLEYAVNAKKHIFCEKPVAVDIPGLRRVMDSVRQSKEHNLKLVSGFCFRYSNPNREIMSQVQNGAIGEIKSITTFRHGGELSVIERKPEWSDLEFEIRNWVQYQRYAGDLVIEQSVHSVDYMNWLMNNNLPLSVSATGGRQTKPWDGIGNTFDHFAIEYDYGNGVKGMHFARQQNGTDFRNSVEVLGTKGNMDVNIMSNYNLYGENEFTFKGKINNMYQTQHDELMSAIRTNQSLNDGDFMINSTLLAIWGKVAAYTGKKITLEQIMNSSETLGPDSSQYSWTMQNDQEPIAKPGLKKFV